jgi:predicted TIM-barrel fold metal-dependent hydrolase
MDINDCVLISVDDHIVEPPETFVGRLPKKYEDKAPRFITREDGANLWVYEGHTIESWAVNAVVGRPPEEWGFEPHAYDEVRPGVYDVHARVKDMSANGQWAALNFPTFPTFGGSLFSIFAYRDADQATEMVRAYNDWHVDAWCGEYPDRFIPCGITPLHDVDAMVREARRLAGKGCHAVTFIGAPFPYPSFFTDHWDRFFAECQELDTVVCLHLGAGMSAYNMIEAIDDAPPLPDPEPSRSGYRYLGISAIPGTPMAVAADLLNSHLFERFPRLKVALSEGGIGWIPYFLDECDHRLRHHGPWTGLSFGGRLPSEIFKEHVFGCFIDEVAGVKAASEFLNQDLVGWESDYPHSDGTWPEGPEKLALSFAGIPDDIVAKFSHENAARFFSFDPFKSRTPEQCTVAALRQEVSDWDVTIRSGFKHRPSNTAMSHLQHAPSMAVEGHAAAVEAVAH